MSDHKREVAQAKGALPIVGHSISLLRNPRRFLSSLPEQGDVVELRLGPSRAYVICSAELTHQVLVNDRIFEKGGPFVERLREFIGDSVSTSLRPEHRRLRRLIQPAFSSNRLTDYMKTMRDETAGVIGQWQDGEVLDVYAGMQAITARIAARTMFAAPASSALIEQAHAALNEIMKGAGRRMLIPPPFDRIPTRGKRRYDRARRSIREVTDQLIVDYRATEIDHNDLMSILLQPDDASGTLSEEEISNQVVTLFLGGVETVASTAGWALCVLALRPEIQQRIHHEIDSVLQGQLVAMEDLPKLPYTRGVILESLRMYPPGWLLTRTTTTDVRLGKFHIPANTAIIYSPFLLGNQSGAFDESDVFKPDRWDSQTLRLNAGSFVPFGDGPPQVHRGHLLDGRAGSDANRDHCTLAYRACRYSASPTGANVAAIDSAGSQSESLSAAAGHGEVKSGSVGRSVRR